MDRGFHDFKNKCSTRQVTNHLKSVIRSQTFGGFYGFQTQRCFSWIPTCVGIIPEVKVWVKLTLINYLLETAPMTV